MRASDAVLEWVKAQDPARPWNAQDVADAVGVSRNTAAVKVSSLAKWGFVERVTPARRGGASWWRTVPEGDTGGFVIPADMAEEIARTASNANRTPHRHRLDAWLRTLPEGAEFTAGDAASATGVDVSSVNRLLLRTTCVRAAGEDHGRHLWRIPRGRRPEGSPGQCGSEGVA